MICYGGNYFCECKCGPKFSILVVLKQLCHVISGELGPPDEFSARVDVEVDNPGPSRVIRSVALRARSGIARVHAPKDLQVTSYD